MVILAGRQAGRSAVPAEYQRVYDAIVARVRAGSLKPGDRLPTIKDLAEQFVLGQSTVKFALALLEREGWTRGVQGKGIYVAENPPIG